VRIGQEILAKAAAWNVFAQADFTFGQAAGACGTARSCIVGARVPPGRWPTRSSDCQQPMAVIDRRPLQLGPA